MHAKDYLGQAYRLDQRIKILQEDIEQLQELAGSVSSPGFEEHYNANRNTEAPFVQTLNKMMERQDELNNKLQLMIKLKAEISDVIEQLESKDERLVLTYRYLRNWTWEKIGNMMYADERTIRRWHYSALSHVVVPENPTICR